MPTLSVVKVDFIKISKWIGLILGIIIGIFLLIRGIFFVKEIVSPTPPPPPTVAFGKLPPAYLPSGIKKNFIYSVDTITGRLPVFSDRAKVYKMNFPEPDILAVERMSQKAASLGFDSKVEQLSDSIYRWRTQEPVIKILVVNVRASEFRLISDFLSDESLFSDREVLSEEEAITNAKSFLYSLSLYPDDLDETKTKAKLLSINKGVISDVDRLTNAKLITVYFFQKDRDGLPVVYPSGTGSIMNVTLAGAGSNMQVIDSRFFYQKALDESATYPIISAEQAFDLLKNGKVFVTSHESKDISIVIKKVYLAYYSPGRSQKYLMPVVVFEGKDDFVAYVSAVKGEWIGN